MSFRRVGRGRNRSVVLDLDDDERAMLVTLFAQVVELVDTQDTAGGAGGGDPLADLVGIGTSTSLPGDPAVARLFPNAYNDDSFAASDFRRYTEQGLRRRKLDDAASAVASIEEAGPTTLDEVATTAWLGALNDLRLVLGSRLDVREDDDPTAWIDDPDAGAYYLYHWLTALQGDLLAAIG